MANHHPFAYKEILSPPASPSIIDRSNKAFVPISANMIETSHDYIEKATLVELLSQTIKEEDVQITLPTRLRYEDIGPLENTLITICSLSLVYPKRLFTNL